MSDARHDTPESEARQSRVSEIMQGRDGELDESLINIAAREKERTADEEAALAAARVKHGERFYSDLLWTISRVRYDEAEARLVWVNMLNHKWSLSKMVGRNVGVRVAALDYFQNVLGVIENARFMSAADIIQTEQMAVTDGLTGLYNHRFFQERLERDLSRAREKDVPLSLIMFDLDYFKMYNDALGHVAGDVLLKEAAGIIQREAADFVGQDFDKAECAVASVAGDAAGTRPKAGDAVAARYGGEEFAVVCYGLSTIEAVSLAERIRHGMHAIPLPREDVLPMGGLTISAGVATYPIDGRDRVDLIQQADRALHAAKITGRNRVACACEDVRRHDRRTGRVEVLFRPAGAEGRPEQAATLVNISRSGLALMTAAELSIGQILSFSIAGLHGAAPATATGRLVRSEPPVEGRYEYGIEFLNAAESQTFVAACVQHMRDAGRRYGERKAGGVGEQLPAGGDQ
jgi:GGDEF domain-containing protein